MVVAAAKCVQGGTVAKHLFICRLSMKGALDGKSENEAQELRSVCIATCLLIAGGHTLVLLYRQQAASLIWLMPCLLLQEQ